MFVCVREGMCESEREVMCGREREGMCLCV